MDWESAEEFGLVEPDGHVHHPLNAGEHHPIAMAGTAYALFRHGQDQQTNAIIAELRNGQASPTIELHVHTGEDEKGVAPVNALDFNTAAMPTSWDDFVGQGPLKRQLMVYIQSALQRGTRLDHTLLASGSPGIGKTTMAKLIAQMLGVDIIQMVPPFNVYTLAKAAERMLDREILFIDEVHKLAEHGKSGAEILLMLLEAGVIYLPDGTVVELNDITVIGATTDRDMLPETVLDRFKIKPYFQPYSLSELAQICVDFAYRHSAENYVDNDMAVAIGEACRGTPRIIEEMVLACRDLSLARGRHAAPTSPADVLDFLEIEPDGLTRTHIHYLTAMYQYFRRDTKDGGIEYIVGEAAIQQILRETKQGIGRVERFLVEQGLIDRTPRGRRLTARGITRAREFIAAGRGAADVG